MALQLTQGLAQLHAVAALLAQQGKKAVAPAAAGAAPAGAGGKAPRKAKGAPKTTAAAAQGGSPPPTGKKKEGRPPTAEGVGTLGPGGYERKLGGNPDNPRACGNPACGAAHACSAFYNSNPHPPAHTRREAEGEAVAAAERAKRADDDAAAAAAAAKARRQWANAAAAAAEAAAEANRQISQSVRFVYRDTCRRQITGGCTYERVGWCGHATCDGEIDVCTLCRAWRCTGVCTEHGQHGPPTGFRPYWLGGAQLNF